MVLDHRRHGQREGATAGALRHVLGHLSIHRRHVGRRVVQGRLYCVVGVFVLLFWFEYSVSFRLSHPSQLRVLSKDTPFLRADSTVSGKSSKQSVESAMFHRLIFFPVGRMVCNL